jgi:hypothetical protein
MWRDSVIKPKNVKSFWILYLTCGGTNDFSPAVGDFDWALLVLVSTGPLNTDGSVSFGFFVGGSDVTSTGFSSANQMR